MYRCAILDDYQNVALRLAPWESLAGKVEIVVFCDHLSDRDALAERLLDFDIILCMRERTPFDRALFERLPKLKMLITTGARNASIDARAAEEHGTIVCGTGSSGTGPTSELAFALIMALARNFPTETRQMAAGLWQVTLGTDLAGASLGLLGLGRLGSRVAELGKAFGMNVFAWSPNLTEERCKKAGVEYAGSIEALFSKSDFISIHLVLGPTTHGLVGERELALMKPTARLINTSRGPIVDEKALVRALSDRRIAGAALDVYDIEPLPPEHPLRRLDNVLATPHLGYVTEGNYRIFFNGALEDIEAWLAGVPIRVIKP
jgi:phosphoglycerate dehydrogenase-like enzyme